MIAALAPRYTWRTNPGGKKRTLSEALELATQWEVKIPKYFEFHVASKTSPLAANEFARAPGFKEFDGTIIKWEKLLNIRGRLPIRLNPSIFTSDEAIVATIAHEVFEIGMLEEHFDSKEPIEKWEAETCSTNDGNFHCQAWDCADSLVKRMRGEA